MARKGKYSERTVRRICRAIERTGQHQAGIAAGGIAESTFYKWLSEKPEFSERVARAEDAWADIDDEEIASTFRASLLQAMRGAVEEWTSSERTILPDGKEVVKVSKKTVKRPPAEWAHRIAASQVGGNFGLDKIKLDIESLSDISSLSDEQLARLADRLGLGRRG